MSQPQGQLAKRRVSRKEAYGAAILGFILEPLWSDYDCAAPRRAQREGGRGGSGGRGCLNNEVECVDKFICLICVWHAIFNFAPSPKPATARVATASFPPHCLTPLPRHTQGTRRVALKGAFHQHVQRWAMALLVNMLACLLAVFSSKKAKP